MGGANIRKDVEPNLQAYLTRENVDSNFSLSRTVRVKTASFAKLLKNCLSLLTKKKAKRYFHYIIIICLFNSRKVHKKFCVLFIQNPRKENTEEVLLRGFPFQHTLYKEENGFYRKVKSTINFNQI